MFARTVTPASSAAFTADHDLSQSPRRIYWELKMDGAKKAFWREPFAEPEIRASFESRADYYTRITVLESVLRRYRAGDERGRKGRDQMR